MTFFAYIGIASCVVSGALLVLAIYSRCCDTETLERKAGEPD